MVKILYSTYAKADLKQVANNETHLNAEEITLLLILLEDFKEFSDGNLGDWATDTVNLKLNPDSKPFNSRYYPVPRTNNIFFRKELKRLVEIGVITTVHQIQYGTPIFIVPKKEGTTRFITDYYRLNQKLVRKQHPLPRIGETIQKLEGFQYATALDLNMGYYTLRLSPANQYMPTIFTEFGKLR